MDRRIDGDAEDDRGDKAGAEIQEDAEPPHHAEEDQDRQRVRQDRQQPDLQRKEHQRHHDEDHAESERQALDLAGDDVGGGPGEQYQIAGRCHLELRRKLLIDVIADALERRKFRVVLRSLAQDDTAAIQ